ncbi:hypothetical protein ASPZODRAFT_2117631 [Penicilliopsis zonata CBS 506.65]|uniref:Zn(2)-C6 fungal-type domain-containing protein n=1 Tax=Penicilliopsis zonata CBS 506.65 TaxID=1073090 RepID=A0A1L9ST15_9EURO|nr:hypothetical protein ASPZODRAFT_2117631 [Penicilliopsis zonata CBS 506.65]OJJ50340.1 hypothetical protein ASPZODRAFT_2117631 [Penicilliopsis zonata CBS 506.65]
MFHHVQPPPANKDSPPTDSRPKERTRQACGLCRQMKIKCDGATPCGHCRTSFNDCVYPESRRKRKVPPAAERLEQLEKRLKAIEESQQATPTARELLPGEAHHILPGPPIIAANTGASPSKSPALNLSPNDTQSQGEARYGESSADRSFIEFLKTEFGAWPGMDVDSRLLTRREPRTKLFPRGGGDASIDTVSLPARDRAEHLIRLALDSYLLYPVLHRPTFYSVFYLLYILQRCDYGEEERRHIPLVYSLMALGSLFERATDQAFDPIAEGRNYFAVCRNLVDLQDCNDAVTLQAIFYMNLFLLNTERMSCCYTYLSHALSLVIRMNCGRACARDSKMVTEVKQRLLLSIRQLVSITASICGVPRLSGIDENDAEYLCTVLEAQAGSTMTGPSSNQAWEIFGFIALLKLQKISDQITKALYPSSCIKQRHDGSSPSHLVSSETIFNFERELQKWAASLPAGYILGKEKGIPCLERAKYELCIAYTHVKILLYRPFLHYLLDQNGEAGNEFRIYASACVNASHDLIRLAEDMHRRDLLIGTHYRMVYMCCTAALSLIYVVAGSKSLDFPHV